MKSPSSKAVRFLCVLCLSIWALSRWTVAQTPAGLAIQTYAGLTIQGAVGTVYSIEYVTELAQTNTPNAWRCAELLQLPVSPYLWADKSAPATGHRFYRAVLATAATNMVFIPPGTFRMGILIGEGGQWDGPLQMAVTITRGFWMGKYEVTQGEYLSVVGNNPSWFQPPNSTLDLTRPAEQVTWTNAVNYCALRTQQERAAGLIPANLSYRLPTEAEWEYACRAWTSTRFGYGDDPGCTNLTNYAWFSENSGATTHPVGQKLPNLWGLYDMHGNVWEWCQDWYDLYSGGTTIDPHGPATGAFHVFRGGNFVYGESVCRSASRPWSYPDLGNALFGFRVVLAPSQ